MSEAITQPTSAQDTGSTENKPKQRKKAVLGAEKKRRRGSRLPQIVISGPVYEFANQYYYMLKALPKVKTANKPRFNTMFARRFMILVYLVQVEQKQGFFTVFSLQEHFRHSNSGYAQNYLKTLVSENWAVLIDEDLKTHRRAVLSPLFWSLIAAVTSHLRREHPEQFAQVAPRVTAAQGETLPPGASPFDFVEDVPDMR